MEKIAPLLSQGRKLLSADLSQTVIASVAAPIVRLPVADDPAALFQFIQHGVQRSEGEMQCASRSFLYIFGDFETVERLLGQQRQDGYFGATAGYLGGHALFRHQYRNPIFMRFCQCYFWPTSMTASSTVTLFVVLRPGRMRCPRSCRNRIRALCSCDLEFPSE